MSATIQNTDLLIAAGINPKTRLPLRYKDGSCTLKADVYASLSVLDRQDAVNRYTWYNLPNGITPKLIETILYYRGQGMLFYVDALERFFFLPYTLSAKDDTGIDCYGRFKSVTPVQIGSAEKEIKYFNGLQYTPFYEPLLETPTADQFYRGCVLLKDYSNGISQNIIPRAELQTPLLDIMSNCIPYLNTCLMSATGVAGMRVSNEAERVDVAAASQGVQDAALTGKKWIPIIGGLDLQDLSTNNTGRAEEFLMALQSLDNYRLGLYGLDNGGVFEKKQYQNNAQTMLNTGASVSLVAQDGLSLRQEFCNIVNSIWPLGIWCEISESAAGGDMNMDGVIGSEQQANQQQMNEGGGTENGGND